MAEQLRTSNYNARGIGHRGVMVFSVFAGNLSMSVSKSGQLKDSVRKVLYRDLQMIIVAGLRKILESGPNAKWSIDVNLRAKPQNGGKTGRDYIFTIMRSEAREIQFAFTANGETLRFELFPVNNVTLGSEPMQKPEQSEWAAKAFADWLTKTVPIEMALTNRPPPNTQGARQDTASPSIPDEAVSTTDDSTSGSTEPDFFN